MFRYSYDTLVYHGEPIERGIERVARYGYDGVEFIGEPAEIDTVAAKRKLQEVGLEASSICSIFTTADRDLAHPDPEARKRAVDYVKDVATMASQLGAPVIIAAPTVVGKTAALAEAGQEWEWAVAGLREAARFAEDLGITLVLEAWNRYETYWINRLDQALELRAAVDASNVGIMGDLFHMNLEEDSIPGAIKRAGQHLRHVHVADSNRAAPGKGHLDIRSALESLRDIDYKGYVAVEILPASADPFGVMQRGGGREFFDDYTKASIDYLRTLDASLSPAAAQ